MRPPAIPVPAPDVRVRGAGAALSLHAKTYLLLTLTVILTSVGDILLKTGMRHVGEVRAASPRAFAEIFRRTFTTGPVWLGVASLLLSFVLYLLLLSWADYSFVQPACAAGYVLVPILGALVLGELVTPVRWAGVTLISLGVLQVGRTPPRTTEPT